MVYLTATAAELAISGNPPTVANVNTYYSFTPAVVTTARQLTYSIVNAPSWTYLNTATGNFYGTPSSNSPTTTDNIVISVSGGTSKVSLRAFDIKIAKAAGAAELAISGTPPTTATVDTYYSFTPSVVTTGRQLHFSIANAPSWTYLNPANGTLFGTPSSNSPTTTDNIVISVSDGTAKVALPAFNINIGKATAAIATSSQVVALAATSLRVAQSAGKATLTVNRSGGTTGAVSVKYATANGTAAAGQNYTAQSGTLFWAAADSSAKTIVVPVSSTVISGPVTFKVALASANGATLGTPAATTVTVNQTSSARSIAVSGSNLVDAQGSTVQLRGVNVSGLEAVAVFGWDPSNPWGGSTGTATPDWTTIKSWGSNVVRLPLNEASWLGLTCVDVGGIGKTVTGGVTTQNAPGTTVKADPGGNYQSTVISSVEAANAAGLYVILDLHLAAPSTDCPTMQNAMADADHSVAFWTSVATTFKSSPAVIFELFNEPFLDGTTTLVDTTPLLDLLNGGGTLNSYMAQKPTSPYQTTVKYTWKTAGMQQMLDAVRATGSTNVVLTAPLSYAASINEWLASKPTDSAHQLGAVWHAYPAGDYPTQVNCLNLPACSATTMADAIAIKAAGYPVVITEYGDAIGGSTASWASVLLPFADTNGISYLGWAWDTWGGQTANDLITDAAGDPTQGYGTYVKAHYLCRAAGTAVCK